MDKFEVEFYTKDNGGKPAKDFILGLDVKMRQGMPTIKRRKLTSRDWQVLRQK